MSICRKILQSPKKLLLKHIIVLGPVKEPKRYKSVTPAMGAFLNYCKKNNLDKDHEWKLWDRFPYIITKGRPDQPQYLRAYHVDYVRKNESVYIDREHYVNEIISSSERFGISFSVNQIRVVPLTQFL
jgi:hypothetical protein